LEITSFLASLSKVLSIFETGLLPPQASLNKLNPAIYWDKWNMTVPRETTAIHPRHPSGRVLSAICSSGIGGVNAHVVVESHASTAQVYPTVDGAVLLFASGLSPRSVTAIGTDIQALIAAGPHEAANYSVVYGRRSRQMTWHSYAVYKPGQALSFSTPTLGRKTGNPLVFLFSGQGPQHIQSTCSSP
jgi:acyl transferase domain-containing protein